jgi:hypothetical protein
MGKKKIEKVRKGTRAKDITLKAGEAAAPRGGAWYAKFDGVDGGSLKAGASEVLMESVKK